MQVHGELGLADPVAFFEAFQEFPDKGLKLPDEPIFDTFSLKQDSNDIVKAVEQGKGK